MHTALTVFPTLLVAFPLVIGLSLKIIRNRSAVSVISFVSTLVSLAVSCILLHIVTIERPVLLDFPGAAPSVFYIDTLSALMAFLISLVFTAVVIYSSGYMRAEIEHGAVAEERFNTYHFKIFIFMASMMLVVFLNNIGLVWAAVEATTLASAFLVGFFNTRESVEAAWKYLIICTVAIALSLFGIVLLNYAIVSAPSVKGLSLDYSSLRGLAKALDPSILKLSFIFVLIGYGTKAGLAPMHTWLPDAHSQSPTPVSALLSGVLLACATCALIRVQHIVNLAAGPEFTSSLMIFFGMASLVLAFPFIMLQNDIKRLLAYSSIEHTGIIYLGLGFGGVLGIAGAFYHILNHAILKSMMFLTAGSIVQAFGTREISKIRGLSEKSRFLGAVLFLGGLGLCGMPPFGAFFSELLILFAGVKSGHHAVAVAYLAFLVLIFMGFTHHLSRIYFGAVPEGEIREAAEGHEGAAENFKTGFPVALTIAFLFTIAIVSGFYLPASVKTAIMIAANSLI